MASPKYFRYYKNPIHYAQRVNKAGQVEGITIQDYFHLLTVRDDVFREDTLYTPYTVQNGQRPDQVSYEVYGDEQFYWVVLQINEITDYYNQWPLSNAELESFVYKKYGGAVGAGATHHWETNEVTDRATPPNRLLEGGLVVPENFIFYYPDVPGTSITLSEAKPFAVSNMTYERRLNEEKAQINILDRKYIYDYLDEVKTYARNLDPTASFVDISDAISSY